jgi:molybdopterin synthase catalytic subunit
MKLLAVVGDDAPAAVDRIAEALSGRVATVESFDRTPLGDVPDAADAAFRLSDPDGGDWVGAGVDRSLPSLLDDLAPAYDHAVVGGVPSLDAPAVAVGDAADDVRGTVVHRAAGLDSLDVDAVRAALADADPHVTLSTLVARAKASPRAEYAGAIATFTGRVRAREHEDDARTTRLEFEAYDGVADERMADLAEELEARDGVERVFMHHRTGVVEDGEDIVFVVVLAGHRAEAFRTVEDGIDRLKEEVPIFKKETTVDEEFWVHDRA